jgi:hypothetical protein
MPSKKEIINKELIKIQAESKRKASKARKAFDIDKACKEALERVENHIEELYNIAKESTRIDFEIVEMTRLLEQHIGKNEERLIVGLLRDLALAKQAIRRG